MGLEEIFDEVERNTKYTFNYDPQSLQGYRYSGDFYLSNVLRSMDEVLASTDLEYELTGNTILIKTAESVTHRICGYIRDNSLDIPMEFCHVYVENQNVGVYTDSTGFFEFEFSGTKNTRIILSYVGYYSKKIAISNWNKSTCPTEYIEPNLNTLGEDITITGYILQGIVEGETYGGYKMNPDVMRRKLATQGDDILKMIEILPGVSSHNESTNNISMRGNNPDQNLIVWEGVNLYDASHFFGMTSSINPYTVDQVNVHKDVFDPKYDNRVGGLIEISLGDEIRKKSSGSFGSNLTESHFNIRAPIVNDKLGISLSYRRSITDVFESPTLTSYSDKTFQSANLNEEVSEEGEEVEGFSDAGPMFYDFSSKIIIQPWERWTTSISFLQSEDDFQTRIAFEEDEFDITEGFEENTSALAINSSISLGTRSSLDLFYHRSANDNESVSSLRDFEDEMDFFSTNISSSVLDQQWGVKTTYQFNSNVIAKLGYSWESKSVNYGIQERSSYEEPYDEFVERDDQFNNLFSEIRWSSEKFLAEVGFRNSLRESDQQSYFSPRLNMRYKIDDHFKLKFSGGRFHQFITKRIEIAESNIPLIDIWTLNDPNDDESLLSNKLSLGMIYSKNGWLVDINGYWIETDGLSSVNTMVVPDNDNYYTEFINSTRGIELLVKKSWKNYLMWVNYDWSKSTSNEYEGRSFPSIFDQPQKLSFINSLTWDKVRISLTYQYRSALPYFIPEDEVASEFNEEDEETTYYLDFENFNNSRLDEYHRLDFSGAYTFQLKGDNLKGEFGLSILNILNTSNQYSRNYFLRDVEEEEEGEEEVPEIITLDKYLLGITPQLSFRIFW